MFQLYPARLLKRGGLVVCRNINASIDPLHLQQLNCGLSCCTFVTSCAISVYLLVLISKQCWTCVCNFVVKDPKFSRIVERTQNEKRMGLVLVFEHFHIFLYL